MRHIYTLVIVFLFSVVMKAEVSVAEKKALIQLYKSTNGANWTSKWDLTAPVSSWYGVQINADKVVAIDLEKNNLVGILPSSIGDLKYLESLNLSFNKIAGAIPASIGDLSSLKSLSMFMNFFSGKLPDEIGKLSRLEVLSLYNNDIEGQDRKSVV